MENPDSYLLRTRGLEIDGHILPSDLCYEVKLDKFDFNNRPSPLEKNIINAIKRLVQERIIVDDEGNLNISTLFRYSVFELVSYFSKIEINKNHKIEFHNENYIEIEEIIKELEFHNGRINKGLAKFYYDIIEIAQKTIDETFKKKLNENTPRNQISEPSLLKMGNPNSSPQVNAEPSPNVENPKREFKQISKEELARRREFVMAIKNKLKNKFICQEETVDQLVSIIFRLSTTIQEYDEDTFDAERGGVLLDGPTGTGKTAIISAIAKEIGRPIVITGANKYTSAGYVGESLTDVLEDLLKKSNGDLEQAETGIIYFDEFDKLRMNNTGSGSKDNLFKEGIQDELLKFFDGQDYNLRGCQFNTKRLTIICGGAFTELREQKKDSTEPKQVGFVQNSETKREEGFTLDTDDYVGYGIKRELLGRLKTKIHTKGYTEEDYKRILLESEISPLKSIEKALNYVGVELEYDEEFLDECASMAVELNLGVRGLQSIFDNMKNSDLKLNDIINFGPMNDEEKSCSIR